MNNDIKEFFNQDKFAHHSGIELIDVQPGYALTKMELADYHYNAAQVVQGGAIFTLADFAFAAASNSYMQITLGLNANINYIKSTQGKILTAEAKEVHRSNKVTSYEVNVYDDQQELIARLSFLGYIKNKTISLNYSEATGKE